MRRGPSELKKSRKHARRGKDIGKRTSRLAITVADDRGSGRDTKRIGGSRRIVAPGASGRGELERIAVGAQVQKTTRGSGMLQNEDSTTAPAGSSRWIGLGKINSNGSCVPVCGLTDISVTLPASSVRMRS